MKELTDLIAALQRLENALDNEGRVMTCSEAAFVLKKTPGTISRYIEQGKLRRVSGNGVTGVPAKDVYRMIWK